MRRIQSIRAMQAVMVTAFLLLIAPSIAIAQATPEASPVASDQNLTAFLPTSDDLGDSWNVIDVIEGINLDFGLVRSAITYTGPDGARLLVILYALSDRMTDRAGEWLDLRSFWQGWADYYHNIFAPEEMRVSVSDRWPSDFELPDGANDGRGYSGAENPLWVLPVGVSLFALNSGHALFVVVDGVLNGEWGTPATITIAEIVIERIETGELR